MSVDEADKSGEARRLSEILLAADSGGDVRGMGARDSGVLNTDPWFSFTGVDSFGEGRGRTSSVLWGFPKGEGVGKGLRKEVLKLAGRRMDEPVKPGGGAGSPGGGVWDRPVG